MEHHSKSYECESCGYSGFYYLGEFKNEDPKDRTKVCADCGHINDQKMHIALGASDWKSLKK